MTDEPADVDLIKTGPGDSGVLRTRSPRALILLTVVSAVILLLSVGYAVLRRGRSEPAAPAQTQSESVKLRREPVEVAPLPPLDETDALVRQLVAALSSHPVVAAWLTTDRLIVNFVVVTGRIAEGKTPVAELKAVGPVPPFRTTTSKRVVVIDPLSYRRYDRYGQAVAALDARGAVRVYETLKPRVQEAYRNFGGPDTFDAELERAIVELLKVPVVEGQVALRPTGIGYAFADPRLEEMSAAQKQLLRMGPENVRVIQGKLREIASHLGIPESRLPRPVSAGGSSDSVR
jgi:Protein of unknown function (DUF3014)